MMQTLCHSHKPCKISSICFSGIGNFLQITQQFIFIPHMNQRNTKKMGKMRLQVPQGNSRAAAAIVSALGQYTLERRNVAMGSYKAVTIIIGNIKPGPTNRKVTVSLEIAPLSIRPSYMSRRFSPTATDGEWAEHAPNGPKPFALTLSRGADILGPFRIRHQGTISSVSRPSPTQAVGP